MDFDGANSRIGAGVGADIIYTSLKGEIFSVYYRLEFDYINNVVECDSFFLGLELAREMSVNILEVVGASFLTMHQLTYPCATQNDRMKE